METSEPGWDEFGLAVRELTEAWNRLFQSPPSDWFLQRARFLTQNLRAEKPALDVAAMFVKEAEHYADRFGNSAGFADEVQRLGLSTRQLSAQDARSLYQDFLASDCQRTIGRTAFSLEQILRENAIIRAVDRVRKQITRSRRPMIQLADTSQLPNEDEARDILTASITAEEKRLRERKLELIGEALKTVVSSNDHELIRRHTEGVTFVELSAHFREPESTLRQRYRRALAKIAKWINEQLIVETRRHPSHPQP